MMHNTEEEKEGEGCKTMNIFDDSDMEVNIFKETGADSEQKKML